MDDPAAHLRGAFGGVAGDEPPKPFTTGPKRWRETLNYLLGKVKLLEDVAIASWPVPGAGTSVARLPKGSQVNALTPVRLPFSVARTKQGGSYGVEVARGYLIDQFQSADVAISNLQTFVSLSGSGYIYLEISISSGAATGAAIVASVSGWTEFPTPFRFTSDPTAYTGSGAPPTQTRAFLTLAKYIDGDPRPLRQVVTTHLQLRAVSYQGLPALFPFAGYGPNDPA